MVATRPNASIAGNRRDLIELGRQELTGSTRIHWSLLSDSEVCCMIVVHFATGGLSDFIRGYRLVGPF